MSVYDRRKKEPGYKGSRPWIAGYTDSDGKRRAPGFSTKKAADAHYRKSVHEMELGVHVAKRATVTFGEALDAWLDDCNRRKRIGDGMAGSTLDNYHRCAERHIRPELGKIKLTALTAVRCQELINDKATAYAGGVQKLCSIIVRLTLCHAVSRGWLARSPLTDKPLRVPKVKTRKVIPTQEDIRALLYSLQEPFYDERVHAHEYRVAMIMLAVLAGLRLGEVAALQWENVDFVNSTIEVRHSYNKIDGLKGPKSEAGIRDVPMVPPLRVALERVAHRANWPKEGFVFLAKPDRIGKPILHEIAETYFFYAMRNAGLLNESGRPKFTFHSLRHAYVSLHIQHGTNAVEIAKLVGHADVTTTLNTYGHVFKDSNRGREAALKISNQLCPKQFLPPPTQHLDNADGEVIDV